MLVRCVENLSDLERYRDQWDEFAGGCVFRTWTWLSCWWRHYGQPNERRQLRVFLAFNGPSDESEALVAVLPAYLDSSWKQGRVLRLIGDGEVCSDHVGLLSSPAQAASAAAAISQQLALRDDWDLLDWGAIDDDDEITAQLFDVLALYDCNTSRMPADRCWAIDLPLTWEEFLSLQSKSHRKQLRQLERRVLDTDRANWRLVESIDQFADAWSTLVDLHQRRRQDLGEPGCFSSRAWACFHWDVAQRLLARGRLRLSVLEVDGRPIAAEYHLAGGRTTYAYQGGLDPDRLDEEPGQLSSICSIKRAIDERHVAFDFLRGDEPYKAHWRATPRQSSRLTAVPSRMWPKLRQRTWQTTRDLVSAARQVARLFN